MLSLKKMVSSKESLKKIREREREREMEMEMGEGCNSWKTRMF